MSGARIYAKKVQKVIEPARHLDQEPPRQSEQAPVPTVAHQGTNRRVQTHRGQLTAADIMTLHRTRGNREIGRLLAGGKLRVANMQGGSETWRVARQPDATPGARNRLEPPPKDSRPTPERSAALTQWLTAHVAGHALAVTTYTFYEVIDRYLGPWGSRGYPLAYGKRYNVLFTTNRTLMAHPVASAWVWKTTILLQKALVDFIVARYDAGTLGRLTEAEFRAAAFASHPLAYTEGGLDLVALVAPEMIPEIASIPSAEFNPSSENFGASVEQVIATGGMVAPRMLGDLIAAAMSAHSGSLRVAAERDRQRFLAEIQLNRYLIRTKQAIADGELNNIRILNQVTRQLIGQEFPNQDLARVAREVIQLADRHKTELAQRYAADIERNPKLKAFYDKAQPGWKAWLRP